jgi:hypothetical protein
MLIQGLEEVMEMSEESDITSSHQSYYDREQLEKMSNFDEGDEMNF